MLTTKEINEVSQEPLKIRKLTIAKIKFLSEIKKDDIDFCNKIKDLTSFITDDVDLFVRCYYIKKKWNNIKVCDHCGKPYYFQINYNYFCSEECFVDFYKDKTLEDFKNKRQKYLYSMAHNYLNAIAYIKSKDYSNDMTPLASVTKLIRDSKLMQKQVYEFTKHFPEDTSLEVRIRYIALNINDPLICNNPNCDKIVDFPVTNIYCSQECYQDMPLTEETKQKISKSIKIMWASSPESKLQMIKSNQETNMKRYGVTCTLNVPKFAKKREKTWMIKYGCKNPTQNEQVKQKFIETTKGKTSWKRRKKYKLPSGKYMILQGFEPQAMDNYILKRWNESDITDEVYVKNGFNFRYIENNKKRLYIPDFYIKPENLIIEVKGRYIYEKTIKNIILKTESVINNGYNFLLLYSSDGKTFIEKTYSDIKEDYKNILNKTYEIKK